MANGLVKKISEWYRKKPIKNTILAGLITLSGITMFKDNVHFIPFGTIEFNSPEKNQYVWGVFPIVKLKGVSQASIKNYSIFAGLNKVGDSSSVGDMGAYGILIGSNKVGDSSSVGDMGAYGIFGENEVGDSSSVGDMGAYGIFGGSNEVGDKTEIRGSVVSRGIISISPSGASFGTRIEQYNGKKIILEQEVGAQ